MSQPTVLLSVTALVEGATGLALIFVPGAVVRLLLMSELDATGLRVARIAGMVLLSFALTCWLAARNGETKAITVGLLVYNLSVGVYFVILCASAVDVGRLLWFVALFHIAIAALLARALRGHASGIGT